MTFAKGLKRFGWWEKFKEEKFEDIHNFLRHVALYVGLIVYTAFGGLVSIIVECFNLNYKWTIILLKQSDVLLISHFSHFLFILDLLSIRTSLRENVPSRASGFGVVRKIEFEEYDLQSDFQSQR